MGEYLCELLEDSQRKYNNTILFNKDIEEPVWVEKVYGTNKTQEALCHKMPLKGGEGFKVPFNLEHIDYQNIPKLGYFNSEKRAIFSSRFPIRKIDQAGGISMVNFAANFVDKNMNLNTLITKQYFKDMLMGNYPSLKIALFKLTKDDCDDGKPKSISFNRVFAIAYEPTLEERVLEYKGNIVARYIQDDKFKLNNRFNYLKELIQESGMRV